MADRARYNPSTHGASPAAFALLAACFFASGATALVCEVVWLRMLGLVFGHTVYAVTTVLAAFMAGLGLGSLLVGRAGRALAQSDPSLWRHRDRDRDLRRADALAAGPDLVGPRPSSPRCRPAPRCVQRSPLPAHLRASPGSHDPHGRDAAAPEPGRGGPGGHHGAARWVSSTPSTLSEPCSGSPSPATSSCPGSATAPR